jgi:hypothetical protein
MPTLQGRSMLPLNESKSCSSHLHSTKTQDLVLGASCKNPCGGVSSTKRQFGREGINPSPTRVFVGAGFIPAPSASEFCKRLLGF